MAAKEKRQAARAESDRMQSVLIEKLKNSKNASFPEQYQSVCELVAKLCPRLEPDLVRKTGRLANDHKLHDALSLLVKSTHVRDINTWKPKGKSVEANIRSLGEHVWAKYKVPQFLWSALYYKTESVHSAVRILHSLATVPAAEFVRRVAAGESAYKAFSTSGLPVKPTRGLTHRFMLSTTEHSFVPAFRLAQAQEAKVDVRLHHVFTDPSTSFCESFYTAEEEILFSSYVSWIGTQHMLNPSKVAPIWDYVRRQRNFSFKGRTALALLRDVDQWHNDLNRLNIKHYKGPSVYAPSGFHPKTYDFSTEKHKKIWEIREILTAKELLEEGKRQSHCVFSYASMIEQGRISIWTVVLENNEGRWANLTLEVTKDLRIAQARGRYNRMPTPEEHQILNRWLSEATTPNIVETEDSSDHVVVNSAA